MINIALRILTTIGRGALSKGSLATLVGAVYYDEIIDNISAFLGDMNFFGDNRKESIDAFIRLLLESLNDAWFRSVVTVLDSPNVSANKVLTPLTVGGAMLIANAERTSQQLKGLVLLETARAIMMNPQLNPQHENAVIIYDSLFSSTPPETDLDDDTEEGDEVLNEIMSGVGAEGRDAELYRSYAASPLGRGILTIIPQILSSLAWTGDHAPTSLANDLPVGEALTDMFHGENYLSLVTLCASVTSEWHSMNHIPEVASNRYYNLFRRVRTEIMSRGNFHTISSGESTVSFFAAQNGFRNKKNGALLEFVDLYIQMELLKLKS
jgi:hypothetical protein